MKIRKYAWITFAIGVLMLVVGIVLPALALLGGTSGNGASVDIIGGVDLPTFLFLLQRGIGTQGYFFGCCGVAVIISALVWLIFPGTVERCCTLKTTAVSLGLSATGGAGLLCLLYWFSVAAFHEASKHPIGYPASVSAGMVCGIIFCLGIWFYCTLRSRRWSLLGALFDALMSILFLPASFFAWNMVAEWLIELT